jgi:WXG100 family type VII secretion target
VPQPIRVDPQDLADAAERVRSYADELLAGHGSAVSTADAAQSGLVGQSAQSIAAKTQRWRATTAKLQRVLASQAEALASAAHAYAQTEEDNRRAITSLDSVDP